MIPEAATLTLLDQVSAELESSKRNLNFSGSIEDLYQANRCQTRVRHYVRTVIGSLLGYNLFLFSDAVLIPDIFALSIKIHIIVTCLAACIGFLVFRRVLPPELIILNLALMFGNTLAAMHLSHSPDRVFYLFMAPIFFLYGNVVLPLPFRFAAAFSLFCVAVSGSMIAIQPDLHNGVRFMLFFVQACLAHDTLISTYRSETFERRSYLLTLRETLRSESLLEQNRELSELSETDGLTGIANRRVFDRTLIQLWAEHLQSRTPLALLMIDIDHFKRLNDTYGHINGDMCLRKTAERLSALMHPHQSLARYGGEEFAVLLEGEGAYRASAVAERLRAEVEAMSIPISGNGGKPHRITISIGCATLVPRAGLVPAELFVSADTALYAAKQAGRNRVQAAAEKEPTPSPVNRLQVLLGS